MAIWRTFFKNLNLLRQVKKPAADYNGCLARFKFKKSQMAMTAVQYM
jgi:hypothetical protein